VRFDAPKAIDLSETAHQKLCVEYADRAGWGHLLIMIPNGMQIAGDTAARARYMASLKAMGLRPGVSDLFLAWPSGPHHGAWFEMKKIGARAPGAEQVAFLLNMHKQGYYADVCYGFDEWVHSVTRYMRGLESLWGAEDNTV